MTAPGLVATPVDERDNGWENEDPTFRVYLQTPGGAGASANTETYDITGADILQVIEWARGQAGSERSCAVALVYDDAHLEQVNPGAGRGLVWLFGRDANRA